MEERENESLRIAGMRENAKLRKVANKIFPIGSRRRELIKLLRKKS